MADNIASRVLDNGLIVFKNESTDIYICSAEPQSFTDAVNGSGDTPPGYALGHKTWGVNNAFSAPADPGAPLTGRLVTATAITDGTITGTGNATKVAVVDTPNSRLLAVTSLSAAQTVTVGNVFTLNPWTVRIPNQ